MRHRLLSAFTVTLLAGGASAAPFPVVNAGFENIVGEAVVNEFTFGPLTGWDLYDPGLVTSGGDGPQYYIGTLTPFEPNPVTEPGVFTNFPDGAAEGQRVAIAFNFAGTGDGGEYGLQQDLGVPLAPFTSYTLRVEIGNIASGTAISGQFFDLEGFSGYRVELTVDGVMVAQDNNTLSGGIDEGDFATSRFTFNTGDEASLPAGDLGIRLVHLNEIDPSAPNANLEVDFDDVRLDVRLIGDANDDGAVDLLDFDALAQAFGASTAGGPGAADFNGDGAVDLLDFDLLAQNFGVPGNGAAAIPEPASGFVVGLAVLAVDCPRRRRRARR
ncbi:MAG: dockerin type I domain-containing protein [Planctomycetota bacterium]